MNPVIDLAFARDILPLLLQAFGVTMEITFIASVFAVVIGFLCFMGQQASFRPLALVVREGLQFIRSTPLLIQVYFVYFVTPAFGLVLEPLWAGSFMLGLHYACYVAEVFRSARRAVSPYQREAAEALGLRSYLLYRRVILPQMLPLLVPGIGNALIALLKDTPVLSSISVMELLSTTKEIGSENFRYIEPMTMCGLIYLAMSYCLATFVNILSKCFQWQSASR